MSLIKTWDGLISTEATNEFLQELALAHLGELSSSSYQVGDRLAHFLLERDYRSLCEFKLRPDGSTLPDNLYHINQVLAFFKKRSDLDVGADRRGTAWTKFYESEMLCTRTNNIFKAWQSGKFQFPRNVEAVLHSAQRKISHVLGNCPTLDEMHVYFGPGATTRVGKRMACAKVKLSQPPVCSEELVPLAAELLESIPGYTFVAKSPNDPEDRFAVDLYIDPGRISFVLKNCFEDRTAVIEPWLNSIGQLGIGSTMAKRLKSRAGIDLRDQSVNRRLAREGSITGDLATLDLSSASDTISTKLVEHLLPPEWFDLLSRFRTGTVTTPFGEEMRLQKFSSMGNGFTFPLESLIFWALTSSVAAGRETVSVYGDDIICPTECVEEVMQVLNCVGFAVNKEKSFWDGPFRESCGGDYLSGIDVRPCYIKGPLRGQDAFRLHNFYVRAGYLDFASSVRKHIANDIALTGPDGFGDGHLIGEWTPYRKKEHTIRGWGGVLFDTWCYSKREFNKRLPGDDILPVYSIYTREGTSANPVERLAEEERLFMTWLINHSHDEDMPGFYESQAYRFTRHGVPVNYIPGTKGCKRISIYTLASQ